MRSWQQFVGSVQPLHSSEIGQKNPRTYQVKRVLISLGTESTLVRRVWTRFESSRCRTFRMMRVLVRLMAIRILIVDDSAVFRDGLRTMLERHVDWQVCGEAQNGVEAVENNRLFAPHLIVMDFSMPSMTGLEAAREIFKESPKVPILLLTLYLTHQLAETARDAGIRAILSKTRTHHLISEIEAILRAEDSGNIASQSKATQA